MPIGEVIALAGVAAAYLTLLVTAFLRLSAGIAAVAKANTEAVAKMTEALSAAKSRLFDEVERCRGEHRGEIKALRTDLSAYKLEVASGYVTSATVKAGFDKLEERLEKLGDQLGAIRDALPAESRPPRRRNGAD